MRAVISIDAGESVSTIQLVVASGDEGNKLLLVNKSSGLQSVLLLERSGGYALRETLEGLPHDVIELDPWKRYLPMMRRSTVATLNTADSKLEVYRHFPIPPSDEQPTMAIEAPTGDIRFVHYSGPKLLALISDDGRRMFVDFPFLSSNEFAEPTGSRVSGKMIGLIAAPADGDLEQDPDHLSELVVVCDTGLHLLRPQVRASSVIANRLAQMTRGLDGGLLDRISAELGWEPRQMCTSILQEALNRPTGAGVDAALDTLVAKALECGVELDTLFNLFRTANRVSHLLPFVQLRCEKNPEDRKASQLLFDILIGRLKEWGEDDDRRLAAEQEIRRHLIARCDASSTTAVAPLLLKERLWSCLPWVLASGESRSQHSVTVSRALIDAFVLNPAASSVESRRTHSTALLQCLSLLDWPSLKSSAPTLINKLVGLLPSIHSTSHLRRLANLALELDSSVPLEGGGALTLYVLASMRVLELRASRGYLSASVISHHFACGSNCAAALSDDGSLMFWGEFSAGTLRLRNESGGGGVVGKKTTTAPNANDGQQTTAKDSPQPSPSMKANGVWPKATTIRLIPTPKRLSIPADVRDEQQVVSVQCGTEHVLVLMEDGSVLAWGRNRYGQCGLGISGPVEKLTRLEASWRGVGASSIHAGHYHSAVVNVERSAVWLFGWGRFGQLATGNSNDSSVPVRIESALLGGRRVKDACLGYAHTLLLLSDGDIVGCGAMGNGQLGVDPADTTQIKSLRLIRLPLPTPVRLLASAYFHGVAVSNDPNSTIYTWGECPATLKMRSFLAKRLKSAEREKTACEGGGNASESPSSAKRNITETEDSREYMKIRRLTEWPLSSGNNGNGHPTTSSTVQSSRIRSISAGYNHSALVTDDGECYTWGKNLEMQLGHGGKKDREEPTRLAETSNTRWLRVVCARNSTAALGSDGRLFVWGRNDKNQLGLGLNRKPRSAARRLILKAAKGPKSVELPEDNNIEVPTPLAELVLDISSTDTDPAGEEEKRVADRLAGHCSQQALNSISRHLIKHPTTHKLAVQAHLLAGDLIHAVESLTDVWRQPGTSLGEGDDCTDMIDGVWSLLPLYPTREVRQLALVEMLMANVPICGRLAADTRFVRLVDSFFEGLHTFTPMGPSPSSTTTRVLQHSRRRLSECDVSERELMLRAILNHQKKRGQLKQRYKALRQKCEQSLRANGQLRFYSSCQHYERCIVESGPNRTDIVESKSRMKKCARCVTRERQLK